MDRKAFTKGGRAERRGKMHGTKEEGRCTLKRAKSLIASMVASLLETKDFKGVDFDVEQFEGCTKVRGTFSNADKTFELDIKFYGKGL